MFSTHPELFRKDLINQVEGQKMCSFFSEQKACLFKSRLCSSVLGSVKRRISSHTMRPFIIETLKPSNEELLAIFEGALKENFKDVEIKLCQCPDLTAEPYNMTSTGFGRKMVIAEVGGPGNLFPVIHKEKDFDLKEICNGCDAPASFVFGPGAGPWQVVGRNCEMVADANFSSSKVATKIASLPPGHTPTAYKMEVISSPKFSLMANLAVSAEPGPAQVVYCKASVRTGKDNFPETIRKGLAKHYGDKCVSVAGVFMMLKGEAKLHVMPDFPGCNFSSREELEKQWLRFFTMKAPLVCASVFHSYDPGHKLRMEHTHCYSSHGDAGHYHYDTTPDTVVYEGYFTAAEKIYRFDEV
ncbi:hypothetical protein V3C99_016866 [Haemonchus contortus]